MPPLPLHNAMWPGLVGKGPDASEPAIGLERMLQFTADARIEGEASVRFDGVDLFLYHPHIDIDAPGDEIRRLADHIASLGLGVGSVVAPVYPDMLGGSAMGSHDDRRRFVEAVRTACRYACRVECARRSILWGHPDRLGGRPGRMGGTIPWKIRNRLRTPSARRLS